MSGKDCCHVGIAAVANPHSVLVANFVKTMTGGKSASQVNNKSLANFDLRLFTEWQFKP